MTRRDGQSTANVFRIFPHESDGTFGIRLHDAQGDVMLESPKHFASPWAAKTVVSAMRKCVGRSRVEVVDENGDVIDGVPVCS
jgi:hypothetical protein